MATNGLEPGQWVSIKWSIEDIHSFRENSELPKWTDERAERFLASISRVIEDRSIELGWEIIGDTMLERENGNGD